MLMFIYINEGQLTEIMASCQDSRLGAIQQRRPNNPNQRTTTGTKPLDHAVHQVKSFLGFQLPSQYSNCMHQIKTNGISFTQDTLTCSLSLPLLLYTKTKISIPPCGNMGCCSFAHLSHFSLCSWSILSAIFDLILSILTVKFKIYKRSVN